MAVLLCLLSGSAFSGTVCTHKGVHSCATVSDSITGAMQGLIDDFEGRDFSVGNISGACLARGHMSNSKHHWGGACDLFGQISRNVMALRHPSPSVMNEVASSHGLTSGCIWRSPDCGHFEASTKGEYNAYRRVSKRLAAVHLRRHVQVSSVRHYARVHHKWSVRSSRSIHHVLRDGDNRQGYSNN